MIQVFCPFCCMPMGECVTPLCADDRYQCFDCGYEIVIYNVDMIEYGPKPAPVQRPRMGMELMNAKLRELYNDSLRKQLDRPSLIDLRSEDPKPIRIFDGWTKETLWKGGD